MSKSAATTKASKQAQKAAAKPRKKADEEEPTKPEPSKPDSTKVTQDEDLSKAKGTKHKEKDTAPVVEDVSEAEEAAVQEAAKESDKEADDKVKEEVDLSDLELEDDLIIFVTHHCNRSYPDAQGVVAKFFAKVPPSQQVKQIEAMYNKSMDKEGKLVMSTFKGVCTTFAMAVPGTGSKLKIAYALSPGSTIKEMQGTHLKETHNSLSDWRASARHNAPINDHHPSLGIQSKDSQSTDRKGILCKEIGSNTN